MNWEEHACLCHTAGLPVASYGALGPSPVVGVSFDPIEERVWLTDSEGFLSSYTLPECAPYCSVRTCWPTSYDDAMWSISSLSRVALRPVVGASGVIVPTGPTVRFYGRGGLIEADVHVSALERGAGAGAASLSSDGGATSSPNGLSVALAVDANDTRSGARTTGKVLVGGRLASGNLHLLDAARLWTGGDAVGRVYAGEESWRKGDVGRSAAGSSALSVRVLQSLQVGHPVGVLTASDGENTGRGGLVVAANGEGPDVAVFDGAMRSPSVIARLNGAHAGGTLALDTTRHLIATVGYTSTAGVGTPTEGSRPVDAAVRIFDTRTWRQLNTMTVPSAGRWGGPFAVRFMPTAQGFGESHFSVLTADGRVLMADARTDRHFTISGGVNASVAAMRRASLRGDTFVPMGEPPRLRIVAGALSPNGLAWSAADADGMVHVLSPAQSLSTSLYGGTAPAASLENIILPWLEQPEPVDGSWGEQQMPPPPPPDATSRAADGTDFFIAPLYAAASRATFPPAEEVPAVRRGNNSFASVVSARVSGGRQTGGVNSGGGGGGSGSTNTSSPTAPSLLPPVAARAAADDACGLVAARGGWHPSFAAWGANGEAGPPHWGNSSGADDTDDGAFDAVLLAGMGAHVPLGAPGLALLGAPAAGANEPHTAWAGAWTASRAVVGASKPDLWAAPTAAGPAPAAWGTPSLAASDAASGAGAAPPAMSRASTLPTFFNETVLVAAAERRRDVDPVLLSMLSKTGAFVDARSLNLRPGSLLYGRRRGYVDNDPRARRPGVSTFLTPSTPRAVGSGGGDDDVESVGSADADEADALAAAAGGPLLDDESEGDSDDAASVSTAVSVIAAAPPTSKRRTRAGHIPRAYRRPRLVVNKFGFFDDNFSRFSSADVPFCGLEEIGPNSLVNAPLQLLFFARALRRRLSRHLCAHPACVACEIRFISDQLAVVSVLTPPEARAVAASTFVRALAFVPEIRRQSLLHPLCPPTADPCRRMDALVRVILDRLSKELGGSNADVEIALCGVTAGTAGGGGGGSRKEGKGAASSADAVARGTAGLASAAGLSAPALHATPLRSRVVAATAPPAVPLDAAVREALAGAGGGADAGSPDVLFGLRVVSLTSCEHKHTVTRDARSVVTDLVMPSEASGAASPSFCDVLRASLATTKKARAYCESCRGYVALTQLRAATSAPPFLLLNASVGTADAPPRSIWGSGGRDAPWLPTAVGLGFGKPQADGSPAAVIVAEPDAAGVLPPTVAHRYELVGVVLHVARGIKNAGGPTTPLSAAVPAGGSLAAAAAQPVSDAAADAAALSNFHYTAALRLHTEGSFAVGSNGDAAGSWFIFNDLRVTPTSSAEARDFSQPFKTPCLLLWQRIDHEAGLGVTGNSSLAPWASFLAGPKAPPLPEAPVLFADGAPAAVAALSATDSAIARSPLGRARLAAGYLYPHPLWPSPLAADVCRVPPSAFSLAPSIPHQPLLGAASPTAGHVPVDAVPAEGALAAIDAEFVVAAPERTSTRADGSRRRIAPARVMPGRVTVIVPSEGHDVLLDEYIVATERVCDYLTRFSGLNPGDLDTASSSFRLHAFKSTYLRLRALLDGGAVLVGHGLRKDARELGILVPPAQAADTVRLWKLPHQRFLSLKFLASYLLGADIQGTVHDSGEDARAALRLYQAWERVRAAAGAEGVERLTHALYQLGRENGWRAAGATMAGGVADAGFAAAATALAGAGVGSAVLLALGFPIPQESEKGAIATK